MRGSSKVGDQICWALDAGRAAIESVGVDLRRADVTVSQKLLDGPDVVPRLEQVRREGVPKGVRSLENRFVQMVATVLPRTLVDADPRRREDPLPGPLAASVRGFARQCPWQLDPPGAVRPAP